LLRQTTELQRSNEDLRQFAYAASHDLREPLRMVAIFCQLLQRRYQGQLDAQADQFIDYAVEGAQRIDRLVKDLRDYVQVADGTEAGDTVTDCLAVLHNTLRHLEAAIQHTKAVVTWGDLPHISVHEVHLLQLFQNLLENALKYRSEVPPRLHLSAERQGEQWRFAVQDNGIGIDPKYATQVFGVFKRLHGPEHPGTGIGLAICQKIVERYGGRIWVESEVGKGSTFYFTLPSTGEQ
jgi:light-regulated signal transduction histidine kinase (bacteriophytochrome)